jgi:hypothetical protein
MKDRIKQWKFGLTGCSRFSFYSYNFKNKGVLKEKRRKEKEDDRNRIFKMWSQEKGFSYEKIIKQMYQAKLKKIKN